MRIFFFFLLNFLISFQLLASNSRPVIVKLDKTEEAFKIKTHKGKEMKLNISRKILSFSSFREEKNQTQCLGIEKDS